MLPFYASLAGNSTSFLLPGRNEPRAVRQVKQCQLAVVVLVSILTAVVIFFVSGELLVPFPVIRLVTSAYGLQD